MLAVAELVLAEGYVPLSRAFSIVSPNTKYTAEKARRRLLQMPLASLCIGDPRKGMSFTIIMEQCHGTDYSKMSLVVSGMATIKPLHNLQVLERQCIKMLLRLAQSDRERECTIFKASGISAKRAQNVYGFQRMNDCASRTIAEVQRVYDVVEDIASMQDKAALATLGIDPCSGESSDECDDELMPGALVGVSPEIMELSKQSLSTSNYNWFSLMDMLEAQSEVDGACALSQAFFNELPNLGFDSHQIHLITQSKEAYEALKSDASTHERAERALEGLIVTHSENENADAVALCEPLSEAGKVLIAKRRRIILRQKCRLTAKAIAEGDCCHERKLSK